MERNYDACVDLFLAAVYKLEQFRLLTSHMNLHGLFKKHGVTGADIAVGVAKVITRTDKNVSRYALNCKDVALFEFLLSKRVPVLLIPNGEKLLRFDHAILHSDTVRLGFYCVDCRNAVEINEDNLSKLTR